MKPQRKGTNDKIRDRLAEHARRMAAYEANGYGREESSKRAAEDMSGKRVALSSDQQTFMRKL